MRRERVCVYVCVRAEWRGEAGKEGSVCLGVGGCTGLHSTHTQTATFNVTVSIVLCYSHFNNSLSA